jgi:hypothetical protein
MGYRLQIFVCTLHMLKSMIFLITRYSPCSFAADNNQLSQLISSKDITLHRAINYFLTKLFSDTNFTLGFVRILYLVK